MESDPVEVEAIFNAAVSKATPQERTAYLHQACAGDQVLRARVEALLRAHDDQSGLLPSSPKPPDETRDSAQSDADLSATVVNGEISGTIIGRYKLLQQIGEGGFGTVFLAEQEQPVRRKVALKIIKLGMDTKQVVARFEAERQALAIMDHPNIAKVLDAGATDSGRPYFVMELVRGVPITDYCDTNNLSVQDRLELFVQVCQAVQHAHQKGIIHRDIKPTNVMVTMADGRPSPKVIDFGIAKATEQRLTERTLFTEFRQMVGTPQYMSPEQAEMAGIDIDTRTDVYSLGVLLYELLVGSTPFDPKELRSKAHAEMRRIIREVEPPRPSTRLSTLAEALPTIAAHRRIEPGKLGQILKGELDWVVMRAMEKDRTRRYETANGLAADVRRYLSGEAVLAAPPSKAYQLKKFVRRNRGPVIAASLVMGALLLGFVGTGIGWMRAQAAKRAEVLRAQGETQARQTAEKRLGQLKKSNQILASIFKDLNPELEEKEAKPLRALLGDRLDQASKQLESEAIGSPLDVAALQILLGEAYMGLGFPEKSIPLFTQARTTYVAELGPAHRDTLGSMNNLAAAYQAAGKLDLAVPLFEESLKLQKANSNAFADDLLMSMANLALAYDAIGKFEKAQSLLKQTLELASVKLGPRHSITLHALNNLAQEYKSSGRLDLAIPMLEDALNRWRSELGPEHPKTAAAMMNLALVYQAAGKFDRALPLMQEALATTKAKLGPEHPDVLSNMSNLANLYRESGQLDLAQPLCEETLKLVNSRLGADHPQTIVTMNNLAEIYEESGQSARALPLLEDALRLQRTKTGPAHPRTLTSISNLGAAYLKCGKNELAQPMLKDALRVAAAELGPEHPLTLILMNNLAESYEEGGHVDLSLPLLEKRLAIAKLKFGSDHPTTLISMSNLAMTYVSAGKFDQALPLLKEALNLSTSKLGQDHPDTITRMNNLGAAYREAGNVALSVPLFEKSLELLKARLGPEHPHTLVCMSNLGNAYRETGKPQLAIGLLEEALRLQRIKLGPDHPQTLTTINNLGNVYRETGKAQQAIPLLEDALKQRRIKLGVDHPRTLTSMASLAAAYEAGGKNDQAQPLFEETLKLSRAKLGIDHPNTLLAMNNLAAFYMTIKKDDLALPLLEETLKLERSKLGTRHPYTLATMNNLAGTYRAAGKLELALPLMEESLSGYKAKFPLPHPTTTRMQIGLAAVYRDADRTSVAIRLLEEITSQSDKQSKTSIWANEELAVCYEKSGRHEQAEALMRKCLAESKERLGDDDPLTTSAQIGIVRSLLSQKKYDQAETNCREVLSQREKKEPDAWSTFNTQSLLGAILLGEKKYAQAEPLLISGYEGMKARESVIPLAAKIRLNEATERLVKLYEEQGNDVQAAQWRSKLTPIPRSQSKPIR